MPDTHHLGDARPADEAPTTDCVGSITSEPARIDGIAETGQP
jgi:hypothetical protein